jgi:uncharacterized phage-associated protein
MSTGHDPNDVARYFLWLARAGDKSLTPMQVLKLVYIAHGWSLGLYSEPMSNTPAEAWQYGPVIPPVYHEFKVFGGSAVSVAPESEPVGFSPREQNLLGQVWKAYGHKSGIALSSLTHQPGTPWDITIKKFGRGAVIPDDLIEEHYKQLYQQRTQKAAQTQ